MSGAPANIRVFPTDDPRLTQTLRGRLEKQRVELNAALSYAQDWADFRHRVGVIQGLADAIDACEQIEKDINAR